MSKKIIVCLDGTGNEIEARESNVLRLYKCLVHDDQQLVYYEPGVGTSNTRPFSKSLFANTRRLIGLIAGLGLHDNVLRAYEFLCRNYEDGDQMYFFGYSRGAYTARVLAGFINQFGLVAPHELHLIGPVFKAYRKLSDVDDNKDFAPLRIFEQFFHVTHPPIRLLGLWDTVNSTMRSRPLRGKLIEWGTHSGVDENPSVRAVRHALSIDERRRFYRQQMWTEKQAFFGARKYEMGTEAAQTQDVVQTWFPGTHTDISGSIPEAEAGLTKIAMVWMRDEIEGLGVDKLRFNETLYSRYVLGVADEVTKEMGLTFSPPDATAPLHSKLLVWFLAELLPRATSRSHHPGQKGFLGLPFYFPLGQYRYIKPDAQIHPSAYERRDKVEGYDPPNLPPSP